MEEGFGVEMRLDVLGFLVQDPTIGPIPGRAYPRLQVLQSQDTVQVKKQTNKKKQPCLLITLSKELDSPLPRIMVCAK